LADIAAEFVRLKVDVIVAKATRRRRSKTGDSGHPIVFPAAGDPVAAALSELGGPGSNVSGLTLLFTDIAGNASTFARDRS